MAERLESGQIQLRPVNASPMQQVQARQVDFTVAAREEARYANTMAEMLDRMGRTINQQAKEMRTEEAIRFAAENPPTLEQIQLAKEGMPAAVPGLGRISGDVGYFGQALKKARTLQVASAFEIEGTNELTKMLADVEAGRLKADQVQTKIASISNGYTKALAKIDPEAAIKFNATMATHGNTVLKTALEADAKRNKAKNTIKVRDNFNNMKRLLEVTVSQGEYLNPEDGQKYSIDVLADTLRANLRTQTLSLGDAVLAKEVMNEFEKELRDAKVNAVTRHILTDDKLMADPALRKKIMTAQLDKMSPVMLGLLQTDMESVAKINANVDIALNRRETEAKNKKAEEKNAAVREFIPLYGEAIKLPEGNKRRKELAEKIADIAKRQPDAVPLSVLKDLLEPPKPTGEGNAMVEFNVLQGIHEGRITSPDQIWSYTRQGLGVKQAVSALRLLYREDKQDQNEIDRGISKLAGIPVVPGSVVVLDPKGTEFQRRKELEAQAKEIEARLIREGKVPTPRMVLSELEDGIAKRRNSEGAKAAKKQLDEVWSKQPWINGPITRGNLPALKEKAKGDRTKENAVIQIEKLLNQAEGQ